MQGFTFIKSNLKFIDSKLFIMFHSKVVDAFTWDTSYNLARRDILILWHYSRSKPRLKVHYFGSF